MIFTHSIRCTIATVLVLCANVCAADPLKQLNIVNWSDYIAPDTVAKFEKETGINVKYDIIDTDDTLQAKLLSGNSGYDVVYPSSTFMSKQAPLGVYEKLDYAKIPNRANLDPELLKRLESQNGNQFGVPYVWGTIGMVMDKTKITHLLGKNVPLDSWDLIFKPEQVSKLASCGVSIVDSASDVFPIVLAYMGRNPNSKKASDYKDAVKELKKIRPYVSRFSSSYLNDVAGGDVCIAIGWSGDARMIARRVKEAHDNLDILYTTPKGQSGLWFTMMGIPSDAPNKENAYKWINFLLRPDIAADITNAIVYPNAVPASKKLLKPELLADKSLYPSEEKMNDFFVYEPMDPGTVHTMNRLWVQFKSGR